MPPESASSESISDKCIHELRLFFVALQFFTRLPIPPGVGFAPEWLKHAPRYFPAVGIVVGAVTALVYAISLAVWPQSVAVLLSIAAGIYLTGALHEDGFADTCDGFGAGQSPERVLEVMKDSRIGAYGAIGIGLMLALKAVVLVSLPVWSVVAALLLGHPLSRLASAALMWRLSYVKADGKAKPLAQPMSTEEFRIAGLTVLLPVLILGLVGGISWGAIVAGLLAVAVATLWLARLFIRRIGGYTGDCLGAVQQVAEVAFYLGLLATVSH